MFTREQCVVSRDTGETGIVVRVEPGPRYHVQFGVPRSASPPQELAPHHLRAASLDEVLAWRKKQGMAAPQ